MSEYHLALSDEERANVEQTSFNYYHTFGTKLRLPPALCFDLQVSGVSMKYIEPDPTLGDLPPNG